MAAVIGFTGFSNSGKTTLIAKLVKIFAERGIRTAVIKHDAHGHYKDAAGTDSSQYREAGAAAAAVVSPEAYVIYRREPVTLQQIIRQLPAESYDLIMVEGFKQADHDKIALFRTDEQADILNRLPTPPIAAAGPKSLKTVVPETVPFFDLDDINAISDWLESRTKNFSV